VAHSFINKPAISGEVSAWPGGVDEQQREPLQPAVDGDMVDRDATLSQQLFDVSVRQAIPQVPPDRQDNHIRRKPESRETGPGWGHLNLTKAHQLTLPEPAIDQRN
jgi:hypothetical protein